MFLRLIKPQEERIILLQIQERKEMVEEVGLEKLEQILRRWKNGNYIPLAGIKTEISILQE